LTLVFSTSIFVAGLANLVAFKEQNLGTALACIDLGRKRRGVAEL
jgi:hypothetical protein